MSTVLIICGAEPVLFAEGRFNRSLAAAAARTLAPAYEVLETAIADGYQIEEEQRKFQQADVVIYQYPVYWFNCPSTLKGYLDRVFTRGVFYQRATPYGSGGLLSGRRYLLSTTWNAPVNAFNDPAAFFHGASLDDTLLPLHAANRYVGMRPLPSFAVHDVISDPDYVAAEARWIAHLQQALLER